MTARIEPAHPMPPLDLRHRGTLQDVEVVSMVGGLGFEVAERQAAERRQQQLDAAYQRGVQTGERQARGSN
jgi:RNA 3'-terminal phosphate cyclase (ATP)